MLSNNDIILSMSNLRPLLLSILFTASSLRAATTLADAFVTTGPTNNLTANNYGAGGALAVAGSGTANGAFASLLRFDVSTDKAGFDTTYGAGQWVVTGVNLKLTTSAPNNVLFNSPSVAGSLGINWISSDSWIEGTGNPNTPSLTGVNWNALAGLMTGTQSQGTFMIADVSDGALGTYNLAFTSGLTSDIANGGSVSFALTAGDPNMAILFNSRSFGTASRRPELTITAAAIPEPSRVLFLLLGAVSLVLRRSRR